MLAHQGRGGGEDLLVEPLLHLRVLVELARERPDYLGNAPSNSGFRLMEVGCQPGTEVAPQPLEIAPEGRVGQDLVAQGVDLRPRRLVGLQPLHESGDEGVEAPAQLVVLIAPHLADLGHRDLEQPERRLLVQVEAQHVAHRLEEGHVLRDLGGDQAARLGAREQLVEARERLVEELVVPAVLRQHVEHFGRARRDVQLSCFL